MCFLPGIACDGEDHAGVLVRKRRCATDCSPYQENPVSTQRGWRHENLNGNTTFCAIERNTPRKTQRVQTYYHSKLSCQFKNDFRPLSCDGAYLTPPPKLLNLRYRLFLWNDLGLQILTHVYLLLVLLLLPPPNSVIKMQLSWLSVQINSPQRSFLKPGPLIFNPFNFWWTQSFAAVNFWCRLVAFS